MTKITLNDTLQDAIVKMAEGNPGAAVAMMQIITHCDEIDPQAALGGFGAIMILDTWSIYGSDIYTLFSDKCSRDVRKMLMIMRATQLGLFSQSRLQALAADQARAVNLSDEEWEEIDKSVCDSLERFALKQKLASKRRTLNYEKYTPPRYDDVYFNGVKWLDGL